MDFDLLLRVLVPGQRLSQLVMAFDLNLMSLQLAPQLVDGTGHGTDSWAGSGSDSLAPKGIAPFFGIYY
jgi:hypothetical protein